MTNINLNKNVGLGNECSLIFSENSTPQQEIQEAVRSLETVLSLAKYENPNLRLAVNIWCGPLEALFCGNVPDRFAGQIQRCDPMV